jgi:uncharacterized protein YbbC (DUF1343 family)
LAALVAVCAAAPPARAGQEPRADKQSEELAMKTEQQVGSLLRAIGGRRVALVTNPTGVDGELNLIADRICAEPSTTITAFFAPEHGLRAAEQAGDKVTDYIDPVTGVPVFSIYGKNKGPSDEQLSRTEVLVFDIQDVGSRFYTFAWSMTYAMESAARNRIPFIVFDRPNPAGCLKVQGAPNTEDAGLVGRVWPGQPFGVATRHGMTLGELATLVNEEWMNPKAELRVIKIPGYRRDMSFAELDELWDAAKVAERAAAGARSGREEPS